MHSIISLPTPNHDGCLYGLLIEGAEEITINAPGSYDIELVKEDKYFKMHYKLSPQVSKSIPIIYKDFGGKKNYPNSLELIGKYNDWNNSKDNMVGKFVNSFKDKSKNDAIVYKNYDPEADKSQQFILSKFSLESFWKYNIEDFSLEHIDLNHFYLLMSPIKH